MNGTLEIHKKDGQNNALTEEVFTFSLKDSENKTVFLMKDSEEEGAYFLSTESEIGSVREFSTTDSVVRILGLKAGTYYLSENEANGYIPWNGPKEVAVSYSSNGVFKYDAINEHDTGVAKFKKVEPVYSSEGIRTGTTAITSSAVFTLSQKDSSENLTFKWSEEEECYVPDEQGEEELTTVNGILLISDLSLGEYTLTEVENPDGFS